MPEGQDGGTDQEALSTVDGAGSRDWVLHVYGSVSCHGYLVCGLCVEAEDRAGWK